MVTSIANTIGPFLLWFLNVTVYYFLAINFVQLFIICSACSYLFFRRLHIHQYLYKKFLKSRFLPAISIIIPAHNEEESIISSIRFLLLAEYPKYEIIVINDGSTDNTLKRLIDAFKLQEIPASVDNILTSKPIRSLYRSHAFPLFTVIDKEQGGKADALNAGINCASHEYICAIDADSMLEEDALLKVIRPIVNDPMRNIATGGVVRITEGIKTKIGRIEAVQTPRTLLALFQLVEYLRAFLFGRIGFAALRCLMIISGAFGVFRRDVILKIGGYRAKFLGEDMELVIRIHRWFYDENLPHLVSFVPDPVCWTNTPNTYGILSKQRDRWQKGLVQSLLAHKRLFFNPHYGMVGLFAFPYYLFFELLGPIIEILAYIFIPVAAILGILDLPIVMTLFAVMFLFTISVSILTLIMEQLMLPRFTRPKDVLKILGGSILEVFTYRPLNHWWRVRALISYLFGRRKWIIVKKR